MSPRSAPLQERAVADLYRLELNTIALLRLAEPEQYARTVRRLHAAYAGAGPALVVQEAV